MTQEFKCPEFQGLLSLEALVTGLLDTTMTMLLKDLNCLLQFTKIETNNLKNLQFKEIVKRDGLEVVQLLQQKNLKITDSVCKPTP